MSYQEKLQGFKELIRKAEYMKYTLHSMIYWDKITYMPKEAITYRSQVMAFLGEEQYKLFSGEDFRKYLEYFDGNPQNDQITEAMVKRLKRNFQYVEKVPEGEYSDYIQLIAVAEQVWAEAKEKKDFSMFQPYLEQIIETFRTFAEYWGYEVEPYDALLGFYDNSMTVSALKPTVEEVKRFLISFIDEIKEKGHNQYAAENALSMKEEKQIRLWKFLLQGMGFDFNRGRIDVGSHATILANSPYDVRIVNTYCQTDVKTGIFNALHSGGKGIYQQSIDPELLGTFLSEVPSFAMEECVGRFYENILGRSRGFWQYFYEDLAKAVPSLQSSDPEELYQKVNVINPSPIRLESDELTYLLHVIIRYELERELIHGEIQVKDLPEIWKEKYRAYLGVEPADDSEGILQDIHWAAGYVGYFPLYFFSNLWAAQLAAAIEREAGDLDQLLSSGNFAVINRWMKEHVFRFGAVYSAEELLEKATGETLDSRCYIDYLRKKYSEVYKLI